MVTEKENWKGGEKEIPSRGDFLELIRKKVSIATEISRKDKDYGSYAGGSLEIASRLALIDLVLRENLIGESMIPLVKLYRNYLDLQRKAFFVTDGSKEFTKLGFIKGWTQKEVSDIGESSDTEETGLNV